MKRRLALISLIFLPLLACTKPAEEAAKSTPAPPSAASSAGKKVRLKTSKGDIVLLLNSEKAPITVANFLTYVTNKHYDGTVFHRVIDGFMIQGGGFKMEGEGLIEGGDMAELASKRGGSKMNWYALVEQETGKGIINESQNGLKNVRGSIAMARTSDPNSATAQFFINVVDNEMLNYPSNGGYAVFGNVIEGMEVVDKIKGVTTRADAKLGSDVPVEPITIQSASVE